ncbi:hypothetical protein CKO35_06940 [Ectothiorhodospira shaposhnikovii]|uniref:Tll0287-like domain-containing protein n=1 Tax=Ectothiorhodospira shaposhnikovii TaxID=1054 RepID=UPI0019085523|nr:DUF3365 domain-containing protein [Ectothiorhodospira shaposhnikovii]MBK1673045.1 hypothetical protein [Ectothiorhodospira shaposhnikovii]
MTRHSLATLAAVLLAIGSPGLTAQEAGEEIQPRIENIRAAVQHFGGTLQGELKQALESGGPLHAIEVCSQRAGDISRAVSESSGLNIGRTSLKIRNPENTPDGWERLVLESFEARLAAGESPQTMEFYEIYQRGEEREFRYMRAIPAGEACLTCHGQAIRYDVEHALLRMYPDDQARGYAEGQIRGAFTVVQPM